jgi:hypothetical protein
MDKNFLLFIIYLIGFTFFMIYYIYIVFTIINNSFKNNSVNKLIEYQEEKTYNNLIRFKPFHLF